MKKSILAIMMMALCTVGFTSCGSSDDDEEVVTNNTDTALPTSEWQSKIIGTWNYSLLNNESTKYKTENGVTQEIKYVENETCTVTLSSNDGTYVKDYSIKDENESEASTDKINVAFTYTYHDGEGDFGSHAYLDCTVTKSETDNYKVGDTFRINIYTLTSSYLEMFIGRESHVAMKKYTRK